MQFGPRPEAARLSVICEVFHCTPSQAKREDPADVRDILEYRLYEAAVRMKERNREQFEDDPDLFQAYQELLASQRDEPTIEAALLAMEIEERERAEREAAPRPEGPVVETMGG